MPDRSGYKTFKERVLDKEFELLADKSYQKEGLYLVTLVNLDGDAEVIHESEQTPNTLIMDSGSYAYCHAVMSTFNNH